MLERHQLQPIVERVLEQAVAARDGALEPAVLIHGAAGWSHHPLHDGVVRIAETGSIQAADAYVCVVSRGDVPGLAADLGLAPPAGNGSGLVVLAQSRAGDVVSGTEPELDAIRARLTELLLSDP
jgi:hypothetical protein